MSRLVVQEYSLVVQVYSLVLQLHGLAVQLHGLAVQVYGLVVQVSVGSIFNARFTAEILIEMKGEFRVRESVSIRERWREKERKC